MKRLLIANFFLLSSWIVFGQAKSDTSFYSLFRNIPSLSFSIEELEKIYRAEATVSPCQLYIKSLQAQVQLLADKSNHQSRLLSMLSGRFDEESEKYDFSKTVIKRDRNLQEAITNANNLYFRAMDDYNRLVGKRMDSSWQQAQGRELARVQWKVYQQELSALITQIKFSQTGLDRLMIEKGYYKQIQSGNKEFPYYIQALEAKGLMLDRVIKLVELIDGTQASVIMIMTKNSN